MEEKINRFIDMLAKRNDPKLNEFFYEIVVELQDLINKGAITDSERGFMDFEAAKLRYDNEKISRMLSMFCGEKPNDITDDELIQLENFSKGNYYTAKSFFDTINKMRSVKSMMNFFYPKRNNFPTTIEELTEGDKFLNSKLWDLTQN